LAEIDDLHSDWSLLDMNREDSDQWQLVDNELQTKVRRIRKKLIQVSNLEIRSSSSKLNPEEASKVAKKASLRSDLGKLLDKLEAMKRKQNTEAAPELKTSPNKVSKSSNSGRSNRSSAPAQPQPSVPPLESAGRSSKSADHQPQSSKQKQQSRQNNAANNRSVESATSTTNAAVVSVTAQGVNTAAAIGEDEIDGSVLSTTTSVPSSSFLVTSSTASSSAVVTSSTASSSATASSSSQQQKQPPARSQQPEPVDPAKQAERETVKLWRKRTWTVDELEGHEDRILDCDVNIEHNILVTSSSDTTIKVWDLATGALTHSLRGHTGPVSGARILEWQPMGPAAVPTSPRRDAEEPWPTSDIGAELRDSKIVVVSGSIDCSLKMWKLEDCKAVSSIYTYNGISKLKVIQKFQYAVIGTEGGKLEMYNLYSSRQVCSQSLHDEAVTALSICETGDIVMMASGSSDGIIKVFQVLEDKLRCMYVSENLCTVSTDTSLHIRPVSSIFISECGLVYYGDTGHNMKMLDWRHNRAHKFANHTTDQGFTDAIAGTPKVLVATGYDVDTDCGQLNIYRTRTDQIPQYLATLADNQTDRITVMTVAESEAGNVWIITGGFDLKIWKSEKPRPGAGSRDVSTSIQGCVLSLGTSPLVDSGTEDSDLEDMRRPGPDTTRPDLVLAQKQGSGFCNCTIS